MVLRRETSRTEPGLGTLLFEDGCPGPDLPASEAHWVLQPETGRAEFLISGDEHGPEPESLRRAAKVMSLLSAHETSWKEQVLHVIKATFYPAEEILLDRLDLLWVECLTPETVLVFNYEPDIYVLWKALVTGDQRLSQITYDTW